jgi:lipoic acid synthetase
LKEHNLSTVCQEARCPNIGECWNKKSATVMILGKVCTRACRFCAVATGDPKGSLDADEPQHVAQVVKALGLRYIVITSVDRDDLDDLGSGHYAKTIRAVRESNPETRVEALIPDFGSIKRFIAEIVNAKPFVIGHNVETVRRLTPYIRDRRCGYEKSLDVLRQCKRLDSSILTKSGLMLGLGEEEEEVVETLSDLKNAGVDVVTMGQYLQPTRRHLPVQKYYTPGQFDDFRKIGLKNGLSHVISGPLVRSSYHAADIFQ